VSHGSIVHHRRPSNNIAVVPPMLGGPAPALERGRVAIYRRPGKGQAAAAPTASSTVTSSGRRVSMKELTEKTAFPAPATP